MRRGYAFVAFSFGPGPRGFGGSFRRSPPRFVGGRRRSPLTFQLSFAATRAARSLPSSSPTSARFGLPFFVLLHSVCRCWGGGTGRGSWWVRCPFCGLGDSHGTCLHFCEDQLADPRIHFRHLLAHPVHDLLVVRVPELVRFLLGESLLPPRNQPRSFKDGARRLNTHHLFPHRCGYPRLPDQPVGHGLLGVVPDEEDCRPVPNGGFVLPPTRPPANPGAPVFPAPMPLVSWRPAIGLVTARSRRVPRAPSGPCSRPGVPTLRPRASVAAAWPCTFHP